jgi:hypothetical protein
MARLLGRASRPSLQDGRKRPGRVHARIDESRKQLRDEIAAATIEGWQLAVVGICIGIVGTIIGGLA